ncbi:hypothetical protein DSO57_1031074, partial [Entomophthora muscae]
IFSLVVIFLENLTVLAGVGVQIETTRNINILIPFTSSTVLFIPQKDIKEILILEGFRHFQVCFYLAFICKEEATQAESIIVAFQNLLPPACVLRPILLNCQKRILN